MSPKVHIIKTGNKPQLDKNVGHVYSDYVWRLQLYDVTPALHSDLSHVISFISPLVIQLIDF